VGGIDGLRTVWIKSNPQKTITQNRLHYYQSKCVISECNSGEWAVRWSTSGVRLSIVQIHQFDTSRKKIDTAKRNPRTNKWV